MCLDKKHEEGLGGLPVVWDQPGRRCPNSDCQRHSGSSFAYERLEGRLDFNVMRITNEE